MDQQEWKNNQMINKKDSKEKCTKISHSAIHQGGFRDPELGFMLPWCGDVDETAPDMQEDAGTPLGQTNTTG